METSNLAKEMGVCDELVRKVSTFEASVIAYQNFDSDIHKSSENSEDELLKNLRESAERSVNESRQELIELFTKFSEIHK